MPGLVWIHGGAWLEGSKEQGIELLLPFARQGYLCVSIEYRLSHEAIFPAQIEDCKCAVRFLRAHAKELRLNRDRIGVWGQSAGGHLAALLGTTGGVEELEGEGGWEREWTGGGCRQTRTKTRERWDWHQSLEPARIGGSAIPLGLGPRNRPRIPLALPFRPASRAH